MSSRATNAALKDVRDETAILSYLSVGLLHQGGGQPPHASAQLKQWREMTAWVNQAGRVTIFNEEANHVDRDLNSCLHETMKDIGKLTSLKEDWNDEGAPEIDRASILRARNFVQQLVCAAAKQKLVSDSAPAVFPTINGGVKLSWKAKGNQIALVFRPGQSLIEIVEKSLGKVASHRWVSENDAGDTAIRAMQKAL